MSTALGSATESPAPDLSPEAAAAGEKASSRLRSLVIAWWRAPETEEQEFKLDRWMNDLADEEGIDVYALVDWAACQCEIEDAMRERSP